MTELQRLIDAVCAAYNDASAVPYHDACAALGDYVVSHADDFAQRERLERAVVEAYNASNSDYRHAVDALGEWLVAHAEADA